MSARIATPSGKSAPYLDHRILVRLSGLALMIRKPPTPANRATKRFTQSTIRLRVAKSQITEPQTTRTSKNSSQFGGSAVFRYGTSLGSNSALISSYP